MIGTVIGGVTDRTYGMYSVLPRFFTFSVSHLSGSKISGLSLRSKLAETGRSCKLQRYEPNLGIHVYVMQRNDDDSALLDLVSTR